MSSSSLQAQTSVWLYTMGLGFVFVFYTTSYLIAFSGFSKQQFDFKSLPPTLIIFSILSVLVSNKISSIILRPFFKIRNIIENFNKGISINIKDDFQKNIEEFKELETFLLNSLRLKNEKFKRESEFAKIASQISHDLKSPLLALEVISRDSLINEKKNKMLLNAISNVKEISDFFLSKYKEYKKIKDKSNICEIINIFPLIQEIVNSQKITLEKKQISIMINSSEREKSVFANINSILFKRVISNLINNAKESIKNSGNITIYLKLIVNYLRIVIKDNGCGIPSEIMSNIFDEGFSYGKKKGTGIGLDFVSGCIESWGGDYDIKSKEGEGTEFEFFLPIVNPCKKNIILLDDSVSVTMSWEIEADKIGINIKTFNEIKDFMSYVKKCDKEVDIYVDSDLNSNISGEMILKELYDIGYKNIFLETGSDINDYRHVTWVKKVVGKEPPFSLEDN